MKEIKKGAKTPASALRTPAKKPQKDAPRVTKTEGGDLRVKRG